MRHSFARQAHRFLIVGVANTIVGLAAIFSAKAIFGLRDVPANMFGYGVGLLLSFVLNKSWTFVHPGLWWRTFLKFLLVFVVAYLVNLGTVLVAINSWQIGSYLAQTMGVFVYAAVFFLGSRYFAFSSDTDPRAEDE